MLSEFGLPLGQPGRIFRLTINNGHARAAGESQDLHFSLVHITQGPGAIDHKNNYRTPQQGFKQPTIILKISFVFMGIDKISHQGFVGALIFFYPLQRFTWILKPRSIGKTNDLPTVNENRKSLTLPGLTRQRTDPYGIVFGKSGQNR